MTPIERFAAARLYVITCPPGTGPNGYGPMVEAACQGGADVVQFRDKGLSGQEKYRVASRLAEICRAHKTLFIVNDAMDLALMVGADGVHLGQEDWPLSACRTLRDQAGRPEFLIGCSTHSLEQAEEAQRLQADYIAIGPVYQTPTKPMYEPVGLELVRQVTRQVPTPHVAIGGIDSTNVEHVLSAGAQRVAVVRSVCGKRDIEEAARHLKQRIGQWTPALSKGGTKNL